MRPGKRKQQKHTPWGELLNQAEQLKASVCAKVCYRGLAKNTARLTMLFALSNL